MLAEEEMTSQYDKLCAFLCNRRRTVVLINIFIIAAIGYNVYTFNDPVVTAQGPVVAGQGGAVWQGLGVKPGRSLAADYNEHDPQLNPAPAPVAQVGNPSHVLLMTYMRGGSTLLGELFNRNPRALYWFEPVDGYYSDLYGARHGWFPLDLLYYSSGSMRRLYDFEEEAIVNGLNNIYSCRATSTPVDVLSNYQFTHIVGRKVAHFVQCMKTEYIKRSAPRPWECKTKLSDICTRSFENDLTLDHPTLCYFCLNQYNFKTGEVHIKNGSDSDVLINSNALASMVNTCRKHEAKFQSYSTCIENSFRGVNACLPYIQNACQNATIIAQKTIRLRADLVFKMMIQNPHLKVVYQVRDPRGIVPSRRSNGLLSSVASKKIETEARVLCQRMLYDISIIKNLKDLYPDRVLCVKYEDFVKDPYKVSQKVYDLLQQPIPEPVTSWLTTMQHGNVSGRASAYNTVRNNSTATAYKWRTTLKKELLNEMTKHCRDVLLELAYDL